MSAQIPKDAKDTDPCYSLFTLLPSDRRYTNTCCRTIRLQSSFFSQTPQFIFRTPFHKIHSFVPFLFCTKMGLKLSCKTTNEHQTTRDIQEIAWKTLSEPSRSFKTVFKAYSCIINQLVNSLFSLSSFGTHHHKTAVSRPSCMLPSRLLLRPKG